MYETDSLDRNNKKMIGDDMVISYKVDSNFKKYNVKSILTTMLLLSGNKGNKINNLRR